MGIISIENSVFTKRPDLIMYFADLEDSKKYNICDGNITVNAQGHTSYAGKLPDGTPLKWMYYDDYVEKYGEPSLQYKLAVNF